MAENALHQVDQEGQTTFPRTEALIAAVERAEANARRLVSMLETRANAGKEKKEEGED